MTTTFDAKGNLGDAPKFKIIQVNGEDRTMIEFSVYFDRSVPKPSGDGFEDRGGFWMNCEFWGSRAKRYSAFLAKGMRVRVAGVIVRKPWEDENGEARSSFTLKAEDITLDLSRVDAIAMQPKKNQPSDEALKPTKSAAKSRKSKSTSG